MSNLNVWIGSGNLTRDAELKYLPSGTAVLEFGMCSNRVWTQDGEKKEEATFVDVSLFGKQAEALSEYLTKGTRIEIRGRLKLDSWETEDGVKRSKLRVIAESINLGPKAASTRREEAAAVADDDTPF